MLIFDVEENKVKDYIEMQWNILNFLLNDDLQGLAQKAMKVYMRI